MIWDVQTGKQIRLIEPSTLPVWRVALSPNGSRLLIAQAEGAALWDVDGGNQSGIAKVVPWGGLGISDVRFSARAEYFVAAGPKILAKVWDAKSFKRLCQLDGNGPADFSPNGEFVAVARNDMHSYTVRIWRIR
jgi:WD40 repeat protein